MRDLDLKLWRAECILGPEEYWDNVESFLEAAYDLLVALREGRAQLVGKDADYEIHEFLDKGYTFARDCEEAAQIQHMQSLKRTREKITPEFIRQRFSESETEFQAIQKLNRESPVLGFILCKHKQQGCINPEAVVRDFRRAVCSGAVTWDDTQKWWNETH